MESEPIVAELVGSTDIAPYQGSDSLVRPAGSLADIAASFKAYQQLKQHLLEQSDYQNISGKLFPKRSAWRKLAVAFGVSFKIIDRIFYRDDDGQLVRAEFVIRAEAPNGRFAEGWASCTANERCCPVGCKRAGSHKHCPAAVPSGKCPEANHWSHIDHDVAATAETRAKNRAAADLFGMGEVSAEEIGELEKADAAPTAAPARRPAGKSGPSEPPSATLEQKKALKEAADAAGLSIGDFLAGKGFTGEPSSLTKQEAESIMIAAELI